MRITAVHVWVRGRVRSGTAQAAILHATAAAQHVITSRAGSFLLHCKCLFTTPRSTTDAATPNNPRHTLVAPPAPAPPPCADTHTTRPAGFWLDQQPTIPQRPSAALTHSIPPSVAAAAALAWWMLPAKAALLSSAAPAAAWGLFLVGVALPRLPAKPLEVLCLAPFACAATLARCGVGQCWSCRRAGPS